jgi:hypothetical protein
MAWRHKYPAVAQSHVGLLPRAYREPRALRLRGWTTNDDDERRRRTTNDERRRRATALLRLVVGVLDGRWSCEGRNGDDGAPHRRLRMSVLPSSLV